MNNNARDHEPAAQACPNDAGLKHGMPKSPQFYAAAFLAAFAAFLLYDCTAFVVDAKQLLISLTMLVLASVIVTRYCPSAPRKGVLLALIALLLLGGLPAAIRYARFHAPNAMIPLRGSMVFKPTTTDSSPSAVTMVELRPPHWYETSVEVMLVDDPKGAGLKSARDIMRKDKGLNGDLDRLPMLTWIMFLKFLDDLEMQREDEAKLAGKKFGPPSNRPTAGATGRRIRRASPATNCSPFINQEEAVRPDGKKARGLFAYLRGAHQLQWRRSPRRHRHRVQGRANRMVSGYLLRDVINKINGIHFTASDEIHTLGALYESMLREMRDAAGDSGEFYTPRAVVRFMVDGHRPAPRRDGARPGQRHGRLPGRGVQPPEQAGQDRGRPQNPSDAPSSAASPSRCPICSAR
jgi:hypothetical protein